MSAYRDPADVPPLSEVEVPLIATTRSIVFKTNSGAGDEVVGQYVKLREWLLQVRRANTNVRVLEYIDRVLKAIP